MGTFPLRTQLYTLLLVSVTLLTLGALYRASDRTWERHTLIAAALLVCMILAAELLDVTFPNTVSTFHVSVSAAFSFAAGLTIGPLLGGVVVILAHLADGAYVRRQPIKIVVNAAGLGLSTMLSGEIYHRLAHGGETPIASYRNLAAVILAATIYTIINTGSLALIVAPVLEIGPFAMWRANFSGLYIEMITLVTLGSLIPVLIRENLFSIVLLIVPLMIGPHLAFRGIGRAHEETRITMEGLADAVERRDPYTHQHSIRVTDLVRALLDEMPQMPQPTRLAIIAAARIHDLGKVGIQDASLNKPGALTDDERRAMEQHPVTGAQMIERLDVYKPGVAIVRHHHERWDGTGYPDGIAAEQIPLGARIIAVADAYDAMTSDRVYRRGLTPSLAMARIREGSGTQFDPQIVDYFERSIQKRDARFRPVDAPHAADQLAGANP